MLQFFRGPIIKRLIISSDDINDIFPLTLLIIILSRLFLSVSGNFNTTSKAKIRSILTCVETLNSFQRLYNQKWVTITELEITGGKH